MVENMMENVAENLEKLKTKVYDILGIDVTEAAEIIPGIGSYVEVINMIANASNTKKLNDALRALSKNENVEKSLNELYGYVSNEERALYVSTAFRKIILANSKIAATIIGLMLGEIKSENREFNNDDVILFNALETMTDFDIRNFKELMENDYLNDDIGIRYFDTSKFVGKEQKAFNELLGFCEKNRLFSLSTNSMENDSVFFGMEYAPKPIAFRLLTYINQVKQILEYRL